MILTGRWAIATVVALALSLAANFVWLGFQTSRSFSHRPQPLAAERLVSLGGRSLPEPLRAEIAAALEPHRGELRAALGLVRDARRAALEAMRAEPYDSAALEAAFAELRRRLDEVAAIGEAAVVEGAGNAPADVRNQIQLPPAPKAAARKD